MDEERLLHSLGDFGIMPATITYAPVGFGDYHWKITGADGGRWFASVADLEHKEHCGDGAVAALNGLRRAMDTAVRSRRPRSTTRSSTCSPTCTAARPRRPPR